MKLRLSMPQLSLVLVAFSALALASCNRHTTDATSFSSVDPGARLPGSSAPPPPRIAQKSAGLPKVFLAASNAQSKAKEDLGRMLFFERRISKNHDISCNSCHGLDTFGVDNKRVSPGHRKQNGTRNSPTVYNAAGHIAQFWDGREPTVEAQAKGPVLNPVEMAMKDDKAVLAVLNSMPEYVAAFKAAFPGESDPLTYNNFGNAIGAFERKLTTPSRYDDYLAGKKDALTKAELEGLTQFNDVGCNTCHTGALLGGTLFRKLGQLHSWPATRKGKKDQGKYEVSKKAEDRMMFKVPSLRNVKKTGPYFHDGSQQSLAKAVEQMAWHQLGKKLKPQQTQSIVAFLGALTGTLPHGYIKKPTLPKSTASTPKPNPN